MFFLFLKLKWIVEWVLGQDYVKAKWKSIQVSIDLWLTFSSANSTGWPIKIPLHYFSIRGINLNFLAIFGLSAVKTNPCGCVSWKSNQYLDFFKVKNLSGKYHSLLTLQTSTAHYFQARWGRKKLYTSKESPK